MVETETELNTDSDEVPTDEVMQHDDDLVEYLLEVQQFQQAIVQEH